MKGKDHFGHGKNMQILMKIKTVHLLEIYQFPAGSSGHLTLVRLQWWQGQYVPPTLSSVRMIFSVCDVMKSIFCINFTKAARDAPPLPFLIFFYYSPISNCPGIYNK